MVFPMSKVKLSGFLHGDILKILARDKKGRGVSKSISEGGDVFFLERCCSADVGQEGGGMPLPLLVHLSSHGNLQVVRRAKTILYRFVYLLLWYSA